jgi:hypothetical protein
MDEAQTCPNGEPNSLEAGRQIQHDCGRFHHLPKTPLYNTAALFATLRFTEAMK